jgi:hypothetical protein
MSDIKSQPLTETSKAVFQTSVRTALNNIHEAMNRVDEYRLPTYVRESMHAATQALETALREANWRKEP